MFIIGVLALIGVLFFLYLFIHGIRNGQISTILVSLFWGVCCFVVMWAAFSVPHNYQNPATSYFYSSRSSSSSSKTSAEIAREKKAQAASQSSTAARTVPEETEKPKEVSPEDEPDNTNVLRSEEPENETEAPKEEKKETKSEYVYKTTYVLNTNTKKFHRSSCSEVKKIKSSNKSTYTGTRKEVIAKGYSPCKKCNP